MDKCLSLSMPRAEVLATQKSSIGSVKKIPVENAHLQPPSLFLIGVSSLSGSKNPKISLKLAEFQTDRQGKVGMVWILA